MTKQEMLDTAMAHLRKQGCQSLKPLPFNRISGEFTEPICAYRGDGGRSCVIGCMITDEQYAAWMEGFAISAILRNSDCPESLKAKFPKEVVGFAVKLQHIHDCMMPSAWEEQFKVLAEAYDLVYTAP